MSELMKERNELVKDLWNAGRTALEIGEAVGLSRNAVSGIIDRAKKTGWRPNRSSVSQQRAWDQRVTALAAARLEQQRQRAEADRLRREELKQAREAERIEQEAAREQRRQELAAMRAAREAAPVSTTGSIRADLKGIPKVDGVSILQIRFGECRWVEGDHAYRSHRLAYFCGKPTKARSSFCDEHHARCFVRPNANKSTTPSKERRS